RRRSDRWRPGLLEPTFGDLHQRSVSKARAISYRWHLTLTRHVVLAGLVRPSTSLMLHGFQDADARAKRGHDGATGDAAGIAGRKARLRPVPENPDGSAETKSALHVSDSFRRPPTAARAIRSNGVYRARATPRRRSTAGAHRACVSPGCRASAR